MQSRPMRAASLAPFVLFALAACSSSSSTPAPAPPTQSVFVVPTSLDQLSGTAFFDHPWPSDVRRDATGAIVLAGLDDPNQSPLIQQYVTSVTGRSTASRSRPSATCASRPTSIPRRSPRRRGRRSTARRRCRSSTSNPNSPEKGQRKLAQTFWRQDDGVYWRARTRSPSGPRSASRCGRTRSYAIVVTNGLKDASGKPVQPSPISSRCSA